MTAVEGVHSCQWQQAKMVVRQPCPWSRTGWRSVTGREPVSIVQLWAVRTAPEEVLSLWCDPPAPVPHLHTVPMKTICFNLALGHCDYLLTWPEDRRFKRLLTQEQHKLSSLASGAVLFHLFSFAHSLHHHSAGCFCLEHFQILLTAQTWFMWIPAMVVTECGGVHGCELPSSHGTDLIYVNSSDGCSSMRWCAWLWVVLGHVLPMVHEVECLKYFGGFHCAGDGVSLCWLVIWKFSLSWGWGRSVLTGHLEVFTVLGMGSVCWLVIWKFSLSWGWGRSVFLSCLCWPAIWCGALSSSLNSTRAGESVCGTCRKGVVRNFVTCYFSNWSPLNSTLGPVSQLCWKALSCTLCLAGKACPWCAARSLGQTALKTSLRRCQGFSSLKTSTSQAALCEVLVMWQCWQLIGLSVYQLRPAAACLPGRGVITALSSSSQFCWPLLDHAVRWNILHLSLPCPHEWLWGLMPLVFKCWMTAQLFVTCMMDTDFCLQVLNDSIAVCHLDDW